jgi:hypothetical protein
VNHQKMLEPGLLVGELGHALVAEPLVVRLKAGQRREKGSENFYNFTVPLLFPLPTTLSKKFWFQKWQILQELAQKVKFNLIRLSSEIASLNNPVTNLNYL